MGRCAELIRVVLLAGAITLPIAFALKLVVDAIFARYIWE